MKRRLELPFLLECYVAGWAWPERTSTGQFTLLLVLCFALLSVGFRHIPIPRHDPAYTYLPSLSSLLLATILLQ